MFNIHKYLKIRNSRNKNNNRAVIAKNSISNVIVFLTILSLIGIFYHFLILILVKSFYIIVQYSWKYIPLGNREFEIR